MTTIDFSPLYRTTIGFDRLASLLNNAFTPEQTVSSYPPYDIEALEENRYTITLAVAGFTDAELDIQVEHGVLTVKGQKSDVAKRNYLYHGIAARAFERKFSLADHVMVLGAKLENGLLSIELQREIPEEMKPRRIDINVGNHAAVQKVLEHQNDKVALAA